MPSMRFGLRITLQSACREVARDGSERIKEGEYLA